MADLNREQAKPSAVETFLMDVVGYSALASQIEADDTSRQTVREALKDKILGTSYLALHGIPVAPKIKTPEEATRDFRPGHLELSRPDLPHVWASRVFFYHPGTAEVAGLMERTIRPVLDSGEMTQTYNNRSGTHTIEAPGYHLRVGSRPYGTGALLVLSFEADPGLVGRINQIVTTYNLRPDGLRKRLEAQKR